MKIDWHVSWKRVGLTLLIVFGSLYAVGEAMRELTPWYEARSMFCSDPVVKVMPVPLTDQSVAPVTGSLLAADGFSVQVPWNETPQKRDTKLITVLTFPARGVGVMLAGPAQAIDDAVFPQMRGSGTEILGSEATRSKYQLMAVEFAATPDKVMWWKPSRENAKFFVLLGMKSMLLHGWSSVYTVSQGHVRGFQVGDPAKPPYSVHLHLFDPDDREYEILISKSKSAPPFSQSEVNAIVASLRSYP